MLGHPPNVPGDDGPQLAPGSHAPPYPAPPAPLSRTLPANLLLSAGSVVLCLLVLEAAFRFMAPTSPPGTTYGKPVRTSTEGFRDREFVVPKRPGTYRILTLGDSFTWGVGLDIHET